MRVFCSFIAKWLYSGFVTHQEIWSLNAKADFLFSHAFFLRSPSLFPHTHTHTLATLSHHVWLLSGPGPQSVTRNQSIMTADKVKQTTITNAMKSASRTLTVLTSLTCLVFRRWPLTDHRDTKKTLLGELVVWSPFLEIAENKQCGWYKPRGLNVLFKKQS